MQAATRNIASWRKRWILSALSRPPEADLLWNGESEALLSVKFCAPRLAIARQVILAPLGGRVNSLSKNYCTSHLPARVHNY